MSRNSNPWFNGLYFCAAIAAPQLPLNATSILIFLTAASCVLLNEKMGFSNFWISVFSISLIVVTSLLKIIAMSVWCPLFRLRRKVSLAKGEPISSYIGILYPAPKISNLNFNFKLRWHKILPLAPRNYFLLAPTWIFLRIGDSWIFLWGIPLCFFQLGFTRLLLSWGTT